MKTVRLILLAALAYVVSFLVFGVDWLLPEHRAIYTAAYWNVWGCLGVLAIALLIAIVKVVDEVFCFFCRIDQVNRIKIEEYEQKRRGQR